MSNDDKSSVVPKVVGLIVALVLCSPCIYLVVGAVREVWNPEEPGVTIVGLLLIVTVLLLVYAAFSDF
jgi:hypothetical protein